MTEKAIGLSADYVSYPGETLYEVLQDRGITQADLASRADVTPAFISNIITGKKRISATLAKKLEYILGVDACYWINLQAQYDSKIAQINELNNISKEEINIIKERHAIVDYLNKYGFICDGNVTNIVLQLRRFCEVSNLLNIPKLSISGAFRRSTKDNTDLYSTYFWLRACELKASEITLDEELNIQFLKNCLDDIKNVMFAPVEVMETALTAIFQKCGIAFCIVKNFKNVPVQGYIKKLSNHNIMLCMTIRKSFADIFWFTLFHEIYHILNGDYNNEMIDLFESKNENEKKADNFAANVLIPEYDYNNFTKSIKKECEQGANGEKILLLIKQFAKEKDVQPYIVIGRLQKDGLLSYSCFSHEKIRYKWVAEE